MNPPVYSSTTERRVSRVIPDLVQARELLMDLVKKDLRVRYRYATMGFLWAILEPIALMLILTFVFSYVLADKLGVDPAAMQRPFALSVLCGLIFWQFASESIRSATGSLVDNQNLVQKVRFTREVVPLAALGYPLINLLIGLLLLLAFQVALTGTVHPLALPWLLPILLVQILLLAGFALIFSCAHAHFRDIGYMVGVAVLFGFYASPIFYEVDRVVGSDLLPGWAKTLYFLNPMAGIIATSRQVLLDGTMPQWSLLLWPGILATVALFLGAWLFRRAAPTLSDHL